MRRLATRWIILVLGATPLVANAQPSQREPSQSEPSQSEPSQSEPSQSEPSQSDQFDQFEQVEPSDLPRADDPARATEGASEDPLLRELEPILRCAPVAALPHGDALIVACRHRVVSVQRDSRTLGWQMQPRSAVEGLARAESGQVVATTLGGTPADLCATEPLVRVLEERRACGSLVTGSERDLVEVRAGPLARLEPGRLLAFYADGPDGAVRVATGVVVDTQGGEGPDGTVTASVRVGLGERVPVGAHALAADGLDHSLLAPPRVAERLVLRGSVDALVPFDEGPGVFLTLDVAWHLEAPVVLRAGLAPLAVGARNGAGILALLGYASVGLDLDWMEVSVGVAATTINQRPRGQATAAFAPLLGVRLGAFDGLALDVQLFFTVDDVGLDLGVGRARLTLPITVGHRIVARADVGRHGAVRVDAGLVIFLDGRGDRGSLALGIYAGAGHIYYQRVCPAGFCERTGVLAPTVGLELDWRP